MRYGLIFRSPASAVVQVDFSKSGIRQGFFVQKKDL